MTLNSKQNSLRVSAKLSSVMPISTEQLNFSPSISMPGMLLALMALQTA